MTRDDGSLREPAEGGTSRREIQAEEAALAAIRDRAESVRDRELERALAELGEEDDLSEADRAAVERVADRLVARLVAVPERALASPDVDEETVEAARDLFG